jgi:hypothetical protein
MKKISISIILLTLAGMAFAFPIMINSWNVDSDVKTLNQMGVSIDNVNRSTGNISADVRDQHEYNELLNHGFQISKLPDIARENAQKLMLDKSLTPTRDQYYTIAQYLQFMVDTSTQYPAICQLVQAGTSVQNRPLYFLKITDNPTISEPEPEFRYISSMHGNEVVGYDMCIRLIQLLTSNYGTDTRITNLINTTEIWICPLMNPDGYVLGQRYNFNGIDLNRNFPHPTGNQHPDGNAWQQETQAMMNLGNDHHFILSANMHCGALVMNYPWDYTYTLAPDDALLQQASLAYSVHNLPMYNSSEFVHGITNGAAWYVATGTMQDWNYGYTDCMDITAEISNVFWPDPSILPTYWSQNQESMLSYMEFVHKGINGIVTNSAGAPLNASITVSGNAKVVHTDPACGDYHRMLLPGSYTVIAEAAGYVPQAYAITVPASGSVNHNFVLSEAQMVDLHGQLRNTQGTGIAGAQVSLSTTPLTSATTDAQGCFTFTGLYEDIYTLQASIMGAAIYNKDFQLSTANSYSVFVVQEPQTRLNDHCDSIVNWTATSPWGVTTYQGQSVITDSPTGNYANNINKALKLMSPISLNNLIDPILSFKTRYALEENYDYVYVQVSTDGSSWDILDALTGAQSDWITLSYSLSPYIGQNIYVKFTINTDYSQTQDGIYLDDIVIGGIDATEIIYGDADGNRVISLADSQYILDYTVGLDPIPQIDPLPWETGRITACDVDDNGYLDEKDAYLNGRYLTNPGYRFLVQGGEDVTMQQVETQIYHNGGDYSFGFTPATSANSLVFDFQPDSGVTIEEPVWQQTLGHSIVSVNHANNTLAWIYVDQPQSGLSVNIQTTLESLTLDYEVNGYPETVTLHPGSANSDDVVPVYEFSLKQNYPNPFNPATRIAFSLQSNDPKVSLEIYNIKGQLVRSLISGFQHAGNHNILWDGKDNAGASVSSGMYLYRLTSSENSITRRMILAQ